MICYHGGPISGPDTVAASVWAGRDSLVSFYSPSQLPIAAEVSRSFVLDNGAFSAWVKNKPITDWEPYYKWVDEWQRHPGFEWAIIPDKIDGDEDDNDALLNDWPFKFNGVPVWHLHERLSRLWRLVEAYPIVALGSSGDYAQIATAAWWHRMADVMRGACDGRGRPKAKLHGLRMLDPTILAHLPLHSADSTNVGRNIGLDTRWSGTYTPTSLKVRAQVIMDRIESHAKASVWSGTAGNQLNFELLDCNEALM